MDNSKIYHLYTLLCVHHLRLSLHPSSFILPMPSSMLLLLAPPQQSPHRCPCLWVFFSFFLYPSTPSPAPTLKTVSLLSIYQSVNIWLVSSFCSLDSTHKWMVWYLSFPDWLISLSLMLSGPIHVVTKTKISFFSTAE